MQRQSTSRIPKFFRSAAWWIVVALLGTSARAQFTYSEDFKNSTAAGWVLNPAGNSTPNVTLTSGAAPRSGDPEPGPTIDPSGSGWLRLTNNTLNTHNAVYFDTPIPSAGNSVTIQFGMNLWGGNDFAGTGADGLTFFLYDASKPFQVGADGGSIGYAQKTGVDGLNGGFVAVALDAYGNFSVQAEGRVGGTGTLQPNSVAVRGPGQGTNDYNYLAGTGNRDYTDTGSPTVLDGGDGTVPALPYTMAYPDATARPNQSTQYRNVSVTIDENSQLLVGMQFGEDGLWYNLLNVDLSSFVRPEQLKMGFSAGTGSGTIVSEVGGLLSVNATAGSGNFVWDNGDGPSNKVWGTGATNPLNWAGNTNPTLKSNVIFNSTYISSAQSIDVTGSDKVIQNLYFSGANGYTLNTSEARKLIFDSATVGGLTAINLTSEVSGNAAHTIALDAQMNRNLDINNNISPTFTVSGNIDNGGNILTLKGTGTTVLSGALSGSGTLVKNDSGTSVISGAGVNTYTGATTITAGTLQIEKATALGSTAAGTTVNSGGTLALAGSGTAFAAESLTLNGAGVGNNGALRNAAGDNTWTGSIALASASSIGADTGTNLGITGIVSGAGALTKVGSGNVTLAGANTFTGATNINAGTLIISNENNLGANPGAFNAAQLNLDGGTLRTVTSAVTINDSNRGVTIGAAGGTLDTATDLTIANAVAGSGLLTKTGSGTLTLSATNTHTGNIAINAGTLTAQNGSAIGNTSAVTIASGATLNTTGYSETVGSIAGAGNLTLGSSGTTTFTSGGNDQSTTFSGIVSGGATNHFTKTGTGTLSLTGNNTMSGNVTVANGGLLLNASGGALGSASNITISTGGTLTLGASNQISDNANLILSGGTFSSGGFNETMRQLSQTTASTIDYLNDGGILQFNGVTGTVNGLGSVTGTLAINNWAGSISGSGTEQLVVYSTSGAPNVSNIVFTDWGAATTIDRGAGLYEIVPTATGVNWNVDSSTTQIWASNGNWSPNTAFPNGNNTIAILGNTIGSPPLDNNITISMESTSRTVGKLIFENSANRNYTIGTGTSGRLDFNVTSGSAQIIVNDDGSHTLAAGSRFNDSMLITNNSGAATGLTLSGAISLRDGDGNNGSGSNLLTVNGGGTTLISGAISQSGTTGSLLKTGSGTLILSNTGNSYTGSTTVRNGTLQVNADSASGSSGALGNASSSIVVNDASTTASMNTGLLIGANGVDIGRSVTIANYGASTTIGGATSFTSGSGTFNNTITFNRSLNLNASGSSTITLSGALTDGAGSGGTSALTKTGSGTVILSGGSANVGTGSVTVSEGTLQIAKSVANGGIGDTAAVTVANGATLSFNAGQNETIGSLAGAGTVDNINGTGMTLTAGGNNASTTFSGVIQDTGAGNLSLTKAGTGNLVLSGNNAYAGTTTISNGTLTAQHINALGNSGASTTTSVTGGATLALDLAGTNTFANESLTLNGNGLGGNGALRNVSGNNTWSGGIALATGSTIQSDSGTLTIGTTNITGTGLGLIIAGAGNTTISSSVATGTGGTLTKNGAGTLTLGTANTYTGATAINGGTVEIQSATALGTDAAGTTISNGATLVIGGSAYSTSEGLSVGGQGIGSAGAIRNIGADHTLSGNIALTAESYVGVASGTTLTVSGNVSGTGFGLTKVDAGTLILSSANGYTGTTAINAGTLQLTGAGTLGTNATPTTIASGATLALNNLSGTSTENITANGAGVGGAGAIQSIAGTNTISGNVAMTGNSTVGVSSGNLTLSGNITGGYSFIKTGGGNLTLSGAASSYTGSTTLRDGTLTVATNAPLSANGALGNSGSSVQVGDASTGTSADLSLLIGNAAGGVTLARAISVNNFNSSGTTTLGGANTSGTNSFTGNIGLGRDVSLTAASGGTVNFAGELSGSGGVTKSGAGTVILSGNNSFSGSTTVTSGTLVAASNNALGSTAATTSVSSGATLGLQGNITIPAGESLTLSGNGVSSAGALNSISGNNTVAGSVALAGATTIGSATAGSTLSLTGAISGAQNLATAGAGNLAFNGVNTNSGTLTIGGSAGAIASLGASASFANISSLTINSGNTFSLGADNQINNSANLFLAGGTLNVGSFDATFNRLSQSSASTIDYLNDGSVLRFDSTLGLDTITGTLTIANWAGSLSGSGSEQFVIYSPTTPDVANFNFAGWGSGAATYISRAGDLGANYYEILPAVTATEWNVNGNGLWGTGTNWVGNTSPNSVGAIARLGNLGSAAPLTANPTVSVDAAATVGALVFDNAAGSNYTVNSSNGSVLTLDASSGAASLIVNDGNSHTLSVNSQFLEGLTITNNSGAATGLTISGNLTQNVAGTQTLTATGTGRTLITGIIENTLGTTDLLKTGAGILTLSGANTFGGTTTVRNGVLEVNSNDALGSGSSTVAINDGSTTGAMNTALYLGASGVTLSRNLSVGSQGATTTLGGDFASGASTFSGTITLNKSVNLNADGTSVVNFDGQLIDGTGTTNITKTGAGTVVLGSTANNYDGATNIDTGTLRLGAANVVPNGSAVSVATGATLDLNGFSETIGSLAGSGNVTGTSGTITLTTGGNNASTTFSGLISDSAGTLLLDKTGTGTMTLSGANTYDGATTVSAGTLIAAHNTALGSATGGTTVATGATLGLQGGITVTGESLSVAAATSPSNASVANLSGTNVWTGNVSMTGGVANDQVKFDAAGGSQLTISGIISEATNAKVLAKTGSGTLVLSGANTHTGSTNVTSGTLVVANNSALGTTAAGTSVQIGATLGVQNNVSIASGESYILHGTTIPPSAPSIKNIADTNTLAGNITLSGGTNTGVSIDSNTGSLTLSGVIAQTSNPNYIIKTGTGDLTLSGTAANTFSGGFTINDGTVIAAKTAGVVATGAAAVNIGDNIGAAASAILQLNANDQIADGSNVTIQPDGRLDLQSYNDTIGALTLTGGNVQGSGTLTLGNNLTFNGVGSTTSSITSNLDLGSANLASGSRVVQVGNNGVNGDVDLTINGTIGGGSTGFRKTDLGTLELAGASANTFSGGFTVADGTVLLNKTSGQNATGSGTVNIGDGSGAANTATLKLLQSEQMANTRVTIASDGKLDVNGLTETIGSFAGAGTIATGSGGTGLLIAGGDNTSTTFSGALTGDGTIRKTGSGTLTFDQNINFSAGTFELNGGTLALGTVGAGITFNVDTLYITGNTVLDFGNSAASVLNATNLIIGPGATLSIVNWIHTTDYFFAQNWSGSVFGTRGQGDELKVTFDGYSNTDTAWLEYGSNREVTPAPEPATYGAMMMGAALGLLGYRRWRKRGTSAAGSVA